MKSAVIPTLEPPCPALPCQGRSCQETIATLWCVSPARPSSLHGQIVRCLSVCCTGDNKKRARAPRGRLKEVILDISPKVINHKFGKEVPRDVVMHAQRLGRLALLSGCGEWMQSSIGTKSPVVSTEGPWSTLEQPLTWTLSCVYWHQQISCSRSPLDSLFDVIRMKKTVGEDDTHSHCPLRVGGMAVKAEKI